MKEVFRRTLTSTSVLALAIAGSALQAAENPKKEKLTLEEVVVTASKTGEINLQDIPLSVTALSERDLDSRQIISIDQLDGKVPGLTVAVTEGLAPTLVLRGVGKESSQSGNVDSVSAHIDGIFLNSPLLLNPDFLDVERVEVLRGPQGTVFGQNSIGGTLNVVTKKPSVEEMHGKADIAVGNYNLAHGRGSVNIPISDVLAVSVAGSYLVHDGFSDNTALPSAEPGEADNRSARVQILYKPTEDFSALFQTSYYNSDVDGRVQKNINDTTSGRDFAQDFPTTFDYEAKLYAATLEWDVGPVVVKSITSFQEEELFTQQDNDRTAVPFNNIEHQNNDPRETFTQEFNISSADQDASLRWVVGAFYMDYELNFDFLELQDNDNNGIVDPSTVDPMNPFSGDLSFTAGGKNLRESWSVYGQFMLDLTDTLTLTSGLRYTEDEAKAETTSFFIFPSETTFDSDFVTGTIGLDWKVNDDSMVYASYTRGAKPGGTNIATGGVPNQGVILGDTYEEEEVSAYEIGTKNRFMDGTVQLNAAAFYYDFEGYQFSQTDPIPFFGGVDNIAESEVLGLEIEGVFLISDSLRLEVNATWLDTEITSDTLALDSVTAAPIFFDVAAKTAAAINLKGNELPKAADFTSNVSLAHTTEIGDMGTLTSSVFYTYRGDYEFRSYNNPTIDNVPAYDTWDLNFRYEPNDANWRAELLVTNIEDDDAVTTRWTNTFGTAETSEGFIAPRQVILRLGMDF